MWRVVALALMPSLLLFCPPMRCDGRNLETRGNGSIHWREWRWWVERSSQPFVLTLMMTTAGSTYVFPLRTVALAASLVLRWFRRLGLRSLVLDNSSPFPLFKSITMRGDSFRIYEMVLRVSVIRGRHRRKRPSTNRIMLNGLHCFQNGAVTIRYGIASRDLRKLNFRTGNLRLWILTWFPVSRLYDSRD